MKKKGVSPIIATVLLIGMVIALALIIFIWMRSFTQETVTKFDGENIELSCGKVEFQASYSGGEIYITNTGNIPVFDMSLKIFTTGGDYTEKRIKDEDKTGWGTGLNAGDSYSGTIFSLQGAEKITIKPILLGNSENGKRTYLCENQEYLL